MGVHEEVLSANASYVASFGAKSELALPPARRFAILTCMDARLDPAKYAGLAEGDAHVIRNAGGRATDDAIRSLVISYKLLGTAEWFVVHHTGKLARACTSRTPLLSATIARPSLCLPLRAIDVPSSHRLWHGAVHRRSYLGPAFKRPRHGEDHS